MNDITMQARLMQTQLSETNAILQDRLLSRRDQLAMVAMQGLLSRESLPNHHDLSSWAILYADTLIAGLDK